MVRKLSLAFVGALALAFVAVAVSANGHANYRAVCPTAEGAARCHAEVVTDGRGNPDASVSPTGSRRRRSSRSTASRRSVDGRSGQTIAIVDAYDDPTAESDLGVFSCQFGLPACTTRERLLREGQPDRWQRVPARDAGWALEISLDIEWAHAIAPARRSCSSRRASNSFATCSRPRTTRRRTPSTSRTAGAARSSPASRATTRHFSQSGVSFFVSAGDAGLPAEYPSASPNVISVGGTTLHFDGSGNFIGETGWSSGGGGCSAYETATPRSRRFRSLARSTAPASARPRRLARRRPRPRASRSTTARSYQGRAAGSPSAARARPSPMWAAAPPTAGVVVDAGLRVRQQASPSATSPPATTARRAWSATTSAAAAAAGPRGLLAAALTAVLSFSTAAQTLTAGQASQAMKISLPTAPSSNVAASLVSSSGNGTFSTSASGTWSTTLPLMIQAGQTNSPSFYYQDTQAGTPTLTASASGYTSATQTETVHASTSPHSRLPSSATVTVGASQPFSTTGADQYGNPVDVSTASWTTNAPGTLSPLNGSTTTFIASSQTGSGLVIADGWISPQQRDRHRHRARRAHRAQQSHRIHARQAHQPLLDRERPRCHLQPLPRHRIWAGAALRRGSHEHARQTTRTSSRAPPTTTTSPPSVPLAPKAPRPTRPQLKPSSRQTDAARPRASRGREVFDPAVFSMTKAEGASCLRRPRMIELRSAGGRRASPRGSSATCRRPAPAGGPGTVRAAAGGFVIVFRTR